MAMKLRCPKCGRRVEVRARDLHAMGLNVEPWSNTDEYFRSEHLSCPFCAIERGGTYWLERVVEPRAST